MFPYSFIQISPSSTKGKESETVGINPNEESVYPPHEEYCNIIPYTATEYINGNISDDWLSDTVMRFLIDKITNVYGTMFVFPVGLILILNISPLFY